MKLTIKQQTTKEVEIEAPMFWQSNYHYYRQYTDEKCIQVGIFDDWGTSIGIVSYNNGFGNDWKEVTEDEFNEAFNKALEILTRQPK